MKTVIDTNVLVSGLLSPDGAPARVLDLVIMGNLTPVFDDRILAEYRVVLSRPKFSLSKRERKVVLDLLENNGQHITAPPLKLDLPDPDDLSFIEAAVEGMCDFLVTGNRKHFPSRVLRRLSGSLLVVTPADLINRIGELYTSERRAEFLLSNAVGKDDYASARKEVIRMGLDPDAIPHRKLQ
ncbi:MAG: putative toxin-antitoxin system toxin component, PIN family [Thermoleophilia bacterium]